MAMAVCMGAMMQCSFGVAPSSLIVLPTGRVIGPVPIANINDHQPIVNIPPFGMCTSMSNPTVASATAAALGVLTPMPCVPVTTAPWVPPSPTVLGGGSPLINNNSTLMCNWGGVIKINSPGQSQIDVP